jgi:hypothetical protein
MFRYTLLPVNFSLAFEAIDFVKKRLKQCENNDVIEELADVENILNKTRKESITLEQEKWTLYMNKITSALKIYHDYGEVWFPYSNEFRATKKEIADELKRNIYQNQDETIYDKYISTYFEKKNDN